MISLQSLHKDRGIWVVCKDVVLSREIGKILFLKVFICLI